MVYRFGNKQQSQALCPINKMQNFAIKLIINSESRVSRAFNYCGMRLAFRLGVPRYAVKAYGLQERTKDGTTLKTRSGVLRATNNERYSRFSVRQN